MVEALHAENLMRGNEYKSELQSMKEIVMQEREEWVHEKQARIIISRDTSSSARA